MSDLGRVLILLGVLLIIGGGALLLAGKANLPLGKLPGDIVYRGKHTTFYFPLATCIVLSVLLSAVFWLIGKFHR